MQAADSASLSWHELIQVSGLQLPGLRRNRKLTETRRRSNRARPAVFLLSFFKILINRPANQLADRGACFLR